SQGRNARGRVIVRRRIMFQGQTADGRVAAPGSKRHCSRAKRRVVIARSNFVQGGITNAGVVDTGGDANSRSRSEEKVGRIGRTGFERQRQRDTYNRRV